MKTDVDPTTDALRPHGGVDPVALAAVEGVGRVITVTIPLDPPSELLPNNRRRGTQSVWTEREVTAQARQAARQAALSVAPPQPIAGPIHLAIHAAYGHGRRLPDLSATHGACKAFEDGLIDAGVMVDDRQVEIIVITHEKIRGKRNERPQGYTTIHVAELEARR